MKSFCLLFLLVLSISIAIPAHAQDPCETYMAALRSDIANVDADASGTNLADVTQVGDLYLRTFKMRWLYEDMEAYPACAERIHPYAIQYFAALEDSLGLSLAWFANPPLRAGYEAEVIPVLGRIDRARGQLEVLYAQLDIDTSIALFPDGQILPTATPTRTPRPTRTPTEAASDDDEATATPRPSRTPRATPTPTTDSND